MTIGFIGLGNMGKGMAANIIKAVIELYVFTRTASKIRDMEEIGAKAAESVADLTTKADLVLACLPNEETSELVFLGEEGVVAASNKGQVIVDHSTVSPNLSRRIYDMAATKEVSFLDAPISGGPGGAAAGTLAIMVGGDKNAVGKAMKGFEAMGDTILHMGPSGSGTITKLVNQVLVGIHTLAACEALLLGSKGGADPDKLMTILKNAWGSSTMLDRNAPYIIDRNFGPSAAPMRNLFKDMGIIEQVSSELGLSMPTAQTVKDTYDVAKDKGMFDDDITAIYKLLEDNQIS